MYNKVILVIILALVTLSQSAFFESTFTSNKLALLQQFTDLKIKSISEIIPQENINTKNAE